MKTPRLFLVALPIVFLTSCSKDKKDGSLQYQLTTKNYQSTVNRVQAGSIQWTSGSAYALKIEFEAEQDDRLEVQYEARINQRIDLFSPLTTLGTLSLEPGRYDEIEVELDLASTPTDTSFVLRGTFTNSLSLATPVLFFISDMAELESEANNVVINGVNDYTVLTTLDLSLISRGVSETMLNNATRTNGVIIISKNSNANIYNIILQNLDEMDSVEIDD